MLLPIRKLEIILCACLFDILPEGRVLCLLLFSHSVVSNSLWSHGLQHTRLFCPSSSPGICSNSCLLSQWCHPSSICPSPLPSIFPRIRIFTRESALRIRWLKYWSFSFSISPSNEYSGLISFRIWRRKWQTTSAFLPWEPHEEYEKAKRWSVS